MNGFLRLRARLELEVVLIENKMKNHRDCFDMRKGDK